MLFYGAYRPSASLCFFVQAKEILSIIIARSTIPIPAAKPLPVSDLARPLKTSRPSPFPPINGVTICIAKAMITVWLKPITKLGTAKGNFTLFNVWIVVPPNDLETSENAPETYVNPNDVNLMIGGIAYITVARTAETIPPPKNIKTGIK